MKKILLTICFLILITIKVNGQEKLSLNSINYSIEKIDNTPFVKFINYSDYAYATVLKTEGEETFKLKEVGNHFRNNQMTIIYNPVINNKLIKEVQFTLVQGMDNDKPVNVLHILYDNNGKNIEHTFNLYEPK